MSTLRFRGGILLVSLLLVSFLRAELILDDPGRFAVDMPAPQSRSERETTSGLGKTVLHLLTHEANESTGFILGYNDYPPGSLASNDLATTYKDVMNGVLGSMQCELTSSGDHQLGDVKGWEYTFANKEGKMAGHVRSYFVGDRLYQIMYLSTPGTENGEEALRFLNSFRLLH